MTRRSGPYNPSGHEIERVRGRGTDITMAKTMHQQISGSELVVLSRAARCSCVEAADDFNRAILAFLPRVA